jgi:ribosome biogenesis GTPase A
MNNLQWYPGHMAKARREIEEATKLVDVVIEIIDARIPIASRNPVLNELIGTKPRIVVLNKSDLADENANRKWVEKLKKDNQIGIIVNSNLGKGVREVIDKVCEIKKDKIESQTEKGRIGFSIKAMVVGIPNVGKSSFINKVAGKATTMVGNKPGVTKKNQWVRLDDRVQLLDTPGVLWPRLDNQKLAKHLAYVGTIRDEIMDTEELAMSLLEELCKEYKDKVFLRYKISDDFKYETIIELMNEIGRKRGCLLRGNEIDYTKTANIIIEDFRTGKIGKITLE